MKKPMVSLYRGPCAPGGLQAGTDRCALTAMPWQGTTKDENHPHPSPPLPSPVEGEEVREGPFSYKLRRGSSNSCTFKSISSIIGGWLCADQDIQARDQPLHVRLQEQGARFPCG